MNQKTMYYAVHRISGQEEHMETSMKVLFILEGNMHVRYQDTDFDLQKEDILLINPGMYWESEMKEKNVLYCEAVYSAPFLSDAIQSQTMMFYCNSAVDDSHSYQDLRDLFYRLTAEYTARTRQSDLLMDQLLLGILDALVEHYQVDANALSGSETEGDFRMRKIMQYIIANLDRDINLTELADEMFISTSTLSRIFKKSTGIYFADYVMQLRVRMSLPQLSFTDQSLTQIALSCGFANSATFSRAFRKCMDTTPTAYREEHRKEKEKRKQEEAERESSIRAELKDLGYQEAKRETTDHIELNIDQIKAVPFRKNWNQIINIGALFDLTRANIQFHVSFLQEQLHFTYIRVWNVFAKRLLFTSGKRGATYNFDLIDQALDFLVEHKLKAYLDFGRRPDMALRTNGDDVFCNDDYIPFEDQEAWHQALKAFLRHIVKRYGQEEVASWYFELSLNNQMQENEQNFYAGPFTYFDAYACMYREIRRMIPGAKFGGTGAVILVSWKKERDFVKKFLGEDLVPDFLGYIIFPYDDIRLADGRIGRIPSRDEAKEEKQIEQIRQLMDETGLRERGVEFWITEWNNSISNRNYLNDSCFRAAYLVHKLSSFSDQVDRIALMAGSDWISSYMDTVSILNGGIGILSKDTIRKPAFYALEMLNQLGSELLAKGDHYLVTRKRSGDLYILCYFYSWFQRSYFLQNEDVNLKKYRTMHFQDEKPMKLVLDIKNPGSVGTWIVKREILNEDHGSILDAWAAFGFESELSRQDVKYLNAVSTPALTQESVEVRKEGDPLHIEIEMKPQEVSLLRISRKE